MYYDIRDSRNPATIKTEQYLNNKQCCHSQRGKNSPKILKTVSWLPRNPQCSGPAHALRYPSLCVFFSAYKSCCVRYDVTYVRWSRKFGLLTNYHAEGWWRKRQEGVVVIPHHRWPTPSPWNHLALSLTVDDSRSELSSVGFDDRRLGLELHAGIWRSLVGFRHRLRQTSNDFFAQPLLITI